MLCEKIFKDVLRKEALTAEQIFQLNKFQTKLM